MVVNDFNVVSIPILPVEADAPLIVDLNAVLPRTMALEFLQSVAGRYPQIGQDVGRIQRYQFSKHCSKKVRGEAFDSLTVE